MPSNQERIDLLKKKVIKINSVSPTFCTAKWLTSTTMLYNGFTHSCHHPTAHKIKVEDLDKSPTALHNTPTKIAARQDMLNGVQTKECDYCWNIENLNKDYFSDRHYKTANTFRGLWDRFDEVVESKLGEQINPSYMEVAFENTCNFKCTYCSPDVSSKWMDEIKRFGGYKLNNGHTHHDLKWLDSQGRIPIHHTEHNPYIEKFWQWWPELYKTLTSFRITGGEPLLTDNTWKVLDYVAENPNTDLRIDINSNLGVPAALVHKLVEKVNAIQGKCENFVLFSSAESVGKQAEYTRFGMKWELFESNIHYFLSNTPDSVRLTFMTTIDIHSAGSFDEFIRFVCNLRKKYDKNRAHSRVGLSVNYLRWPFHQKLTLLDDTQKALFAANVAALIEELTVGGPDVNGNLYMEEIDMLHRLVDWMKSEQPENEQLINFINVFDEMDTRRGTNMLETFPHLRYTYEKARQLREAQYE